jgi:hypothetical protein
MEYSACVVVFIIIVSALVPVVVGMGAEVEIDRGRRVGVCQGCWMGRSRLVREQPARLEKCMQLASSHWTVVAWNLRMNCPSQGN